MNSQLENKLSSREVAPMFPMEHSKLLRKIDGINEDLTEAKIGFSKYWTESSYKDGSGKANREFQITKQGCEFLAHKTTGTKGNLFTDKYMDKFSKMENYIKEEIQKPKMLSPTEQLELQLQAMKEQDKKIDAVDNRVTKIENRMTIETGSQKVLCDLVNRKVTAILGGKDAPAYKELSNKAFRQCWKDYKNKLGVASYKDTPLKDFDLGKKIIIDWQPNRELELMIKGCNSQIRM